MAVDLRINSKIKKENANIVRKGVSPPPPPPPPPPTIPYFKIIPPLLGSPLPQFLKIPHPLLNQQISHPKFFLLTEMQL